jgi:hypothetical protein
LFLKALASEVETILPLVVRRKRHAAARIAVCALLGMHYKKSQTCNF